MIDAVPLPVDLMVRRFQAERSEAAFRAIYRAHSRLIFGLCARLLAGSPDRPEDAAQECWLRAVRSIHRFEGRSRFSTWLCGIAVNVVHEMLRVGNHSNMVEFDAGEFERETDPMPLAGVQEIIAAVTQLPTGYRAAVVLHDLEGFTHDEVADILGISPGTAKSQLSRARARLRALLSDDAVNEPGERR